MAERDRCQATHTAPTIPDGEPLTVQCDLPSGHVAQHESIDGGIIWGKPLSSVGGREPEPREGGFWVSSNQLSPADIAFARTRCGGWDWFVNESGLGWAFVPRLRASTPEGSETEDRTMDGCDPARATYTRAISPPSHDVEALREALDGGPKGAGALGYIGEVEKSERDLCFHMRTMVNLCEMGYPSEAAKRGRQALRDVDTARKDRSHLKPVPRGILSTHVGDEG